MKDFVRNYWQIRISEYAEKLSKNNFEAHVVESCVEAGELILNTILPDCKPSLVAYGGSMTLKATGVLDTIKEMSDVDLILSDEPSISLEEKLERRRQGLLADLYFTGANALTEDGRLVNLDMIGNRVAALTFGPKKVVVLVGRNKIVADLPEAMERIKNFSAPANAMRLDCKTPCVKTSHCMDCSSPGRICNHWTITEKSFPPNRIAVILINEDLGL